MAMPIHILLHGACPRLERSREACTLPNLFGEKSFIWPLWTAPMNPWTFPSPHPPFESLRPTLSWFVCSRSAKEPAIHPDDTVLFYAVVVNCPVVVKSKSVDHQALLVLKEVRLVLDFMIELADRVVAAGRDDECASSRWFQNDLSLRCYAMPTLHNLLRFHAQHACAHDMKNAVRRGEADLFGATGGATLETTDTCRIRRR